MPKYISHGWINFIKDFTDLDNASYFTPICLFLQLVSLITYIVDIFMRTPFHIGWQWTLSFAMVGKLLNSMIWNTKSKGQSIRIWDEIQKWSSACLSSPPAAGSFLKFTASEIKALRTLSLARSQGRENSLQNALLFSPLGSVFSSQNLDLDLNFKQKNSLLKAFTFLPR